MGQDFLDKQNPQSRIKLLNSWLLLILTFFIHFCNGWIGYSYFVLPLRPRFSKYIAYQIILEIGFYFTRNQVQNQDGGDMFIFAWGFRFRSRTFIEFLKRIKLS